MLSNPELIAAYRAYMKMMGRSPETVRRQSLLVTAFGRTVPNLATASSADIEQWLAGLRVIPDTRSSYLSALAGFYRWATRHDYVSHNPASRVERPQRRRLLPRPIADDKLAAALRSVEDARMRLWLCLGAFQGLRVAEIAGLYSHNLLMAKDPPLFQIVGKGQKERLVPIGDITERALSAYGAPKRGPLFPNRYTGHPLKPLTVCKYISDYFRSAGIDSTAHPLRHWFATELYRRTRDLRVVQELMGHSSPTTTAAYAKYCPTTETVAAVRGLSVRPPRYP